MLVYLDSSVTRVNWKSKTEFITVIEGLMCSFLYGQNYILAERKTFKSIYSTKNLFSLNVKKCISKILNEYATIGNIKNKLSFVMLVYFEKIEEETYKPENIIEISIEKLVKNTINKAVLLTESKSDSTIYEYSGMLYSRINGYPKQIAPDIALEKKSGFGENIDKEFETELVNNKRWCLCICDSDKKHSKSSNSRKVNLCTKAKNSENVIGYFYPLECREVENFIPFTILKQLSNANSICGFQQYEERVQQYSDIHKYADLKKGYSRLKFMNTDEKNEDKIIWEKYEKMEAKGPVKSKCNQIKDNCEENPCCNILVPKFGDCLIDKAVKFFENKLKNTVDKKTIEDLHKLIIDDHNYEEFIRVGKMVYEWGYAPPVARS